MTTRVLLSSVAVGGLVALGVAVAAIRLATDPAIEACFDANAEVRRASDAYQDELVSLDRAGIRARRDDAPIEPAVQLRADQAKAELDVARVALQLACHRY